MTSSSQIDPKMLVLRDGPLLTDRPVVTHQCVAEPALISLQVLVLLGRVQSARVSVNTWDYERYWHTLHGLTIGQQTARPKREKCTVVFLCHYLCTDKSLNLLRQIKIAPVSRDTYMRSAGSKLH